MVLVLSMSLSPRGHHSAAACGALNSMESGRTGNMRSVDYLGRCSIHTSSRPACKERDTARSRRPGVIGWPKFGCCQSSRALSTAGKARHVLRQVRREWNGHAICRMQMSLISSCFPRSWCCSWRCLLSAAAQHAQRILSKYRLF